MMASFDEVIQFATAHPLCAIATDDGSRAHVRMIGLWFADTSGFYLTTVKTKALHRQLAQNREAELCFFAPPAHLPREGEPLDLGTQMRASGEVAFLDDPVLKERVLDERPFMRSFAQDVVIFRVEKGEAWFWSVADWGRESTIERARF